MKKIGYMVVGALVLGGGGWCLLGCSKPEASSPKKEPLRVIATETVTKPEEQALAAYEARQAEIGEVVTVSKGVQRLMLGPQVLFEAQLVEKGNKATDGTIALQAVTGNLTPIGNADATNEGGVYKLVCSPREVWTVAPDGQKTRVSPDRMDAFAPLISPDGRTVAFAGRTLDAKGILSTEKLYVLDLADGSYRTWSDDPGQSDYVVRAMVWVDNSSALRVYQDHGETGGHGRLVKIAIRE